jgi:DNA-binding NarL/FixJ family response regulator
VSIRVVVVDDQALVRGGFSMILEAEPGIEVVGEAGDGEEALALCARVAPDVVLMDVRMPGMDGIEATRRITAHEHAPKILVLTTFDLDEYVYSALRAGASGFLLKDTPPAQLLAAVRVIATGEALLAPTVTRRLIGEFVRRPQPAKRPARTLAGITDREREVLTLIARGLCNSEIENHLHLSRGTVKTHIGRLLAKLDARGRAQLVIVGYETGLVAAVPT